MMKSDSSDHKNNDFDIKKYNKINMLVVTKNSSKIDLRWVDLDICDQKKLTLKSKDN